MPEPRRADESLWIRTLLPSGWRPSAFDEDASGVSPLTFLQAEFAGFALPSCTSRCVGFLAEGLGLGVLSVNTRSAAKQPQSWWGRSLAESMFLGRVKLDVKDLARAEPCTFAWTFLDS